MSLQLFLIRLFLVCMKLSSLRYRSDTKSITVEWVKICDFIHYEVIVADANGTQILKTKVKQNSVTFPNTNICGHAYVKVAVVIVNVAGRSEPKEEKIGIGRPPRAGNTVAVLANSFGFCQMPFAADLSQVHKDRYNRLCLKN